MKKYLLPASILLGVVFDLLFWKKMPGISFVLFVSICLVTGFLLIKTGRLFPAKINYLLFVPILFYAFMTAFRREPFTAFLDYSLTLFALALLAMSYLNGLWVYFGAADFIANFFHLIGGMFSLPLLQKEIKEAGENGTEKHKKRAAPILRGLALSLPVWLVFIALLYSADLIFAERLDLILESLNLQNLMDYVIQGILVLLVAYFFSGAILFAAQRSSKTKLLFTEKPLLSPFLGMTETSIVLGGVLLLFAAFVTIQFQYFFSGQANISLGGFTYAEYARRGFGELVAVAILSMVLLKGLSILSKRETEKDYRTFTSMSVGLVALVLAILVSAYQRLSLYESAYGFSRLRTYSHVFMVWLGVLLAAVALMEIFRRQRFFVNIILAVVVGFSVSLNLLNVDRFIAKSNISRTLQGELLDIGYLSSLSTDAIPALASQFKSDRLTPEVLKGVGAALACFQQDTRNQSLSEKPWPSFHFSDRAADRALHELSNQLEDYQIQTEDWLIVVTSPDGTEYPCQRYVEFD